MAELSTSLVEYIAEAGSRGFNPHHDKIFALASDLLEARELLRESKREHSNGEDVDCPQANPTYSYNVGCACECGADVWNARVDVALAGEVPE